MRGSNGCCVKRRVQTGADLAGPFIVLAATSACDLVTHSRRPLAPAVHISTASCVALVLCTPRLGTSQNVRLGTSHETVCPLVSTESTCGGHDCECSWLPSVDGSFSFGRGHPEPGSVRATLLFGRAAHSRIPLELRMPCSVARMHPPITPHDYDRELHPGSSPRPGIS